MLDRYSTADRLCAAGAAVTVIALFLPWFRLAAGGGEVTVNGFRSGVLGVLLYIAAAMMLLLVAVRQRLMRLGLRRPFPAAPALLSAGVAALGFALFQLALGTGGAHGLHPGGLGGVIGAAAMALGGVQQYREDRHTLNPAVLR